MLLQVFSLLSSNERCLSLDKKAMEHLNGFELAGKNIEVGHVIEQHAKNSLEQDDGRARFDLSATEGWRLWSSSPKAPA